MLKARGARVDAFFYCPHYPDGPVKAFAKACDCRKPEIGMIKQAAGKYSIDLKHSYVIGDKMDDLLLGRKAKLAGSLLVRTGNGRKSERKLMAEPLPKTSAVSDILGAAKWILTQSVLTKGFSWLK